MKFKQNILTDFVNYKWKIKIKPYMVENIYYNYNSKNSIDLRIKEKYKEKANTKFIGWVFDSSDVILWLSNRKEKLNDICSKLDI